MRETLPLAKWLPLSLWLVVVACARRQPEEEHVVNVPCRGEHDKLRAAEKKKRKAQKEQALNKSLKSRSSDTMACLLSGPRSS
jgi:hypothetical protein